MMRRMLGAPLGGTTRGGQYGLESLALSLITPPNGSAGGGSCFPSIVVVALGEPGVPVVWICAPTEGAAAMTAAASIPPRRICRVDLIGVNLVCCCSFISVSAILQCPRRSAYRTLGLRLSTWVTRLQHYKGKNVALNRFLRDSTNTKEWLSSFFPI